MTTFRVPSGTLTDKPGRPRACLYIINARAVVDRATMASLRNRHIRYLHELDQSGRLVGAGPALSKDGAYYDGHGFIILRADSIAHATVLADADPFHEHGMRKYTITPWLLSEGILHNVLTIEESVISENPSIERL